MMFLLIKSLIVTFFFSRLGLLVGAVVVGLRSISLKAFLVHTIRGMCYLKTVAASITCLEDSLGTKIACASIPGRAGLSWRCCNSHNQAVDSVAKA